MARVIVTGGSGKVGRAFVEDLIQHGYEVFNLDLVRPAKELCRFIQRAPAPAMHPLGPGRDKGRTRRPSAKPRNGIVITQSHGAPAPQLT